MRFRKLTVIFLILLIVLSGCISLLKTPENINSSAGVKSAQTIILDAGHGGLVNTIMAIFFDTVQPHCVGAKS